MKRCISLCLILLTMLWGCSAPPGCEALETQIIKAAALEMDCSEDHIDIIQHEQLDYFSVWLIKNEQAKTYRLIGYNENKSDAIVQHAVAAESAGFIYFEETKSMGFGVIYLSNPKSRPLWLKLMDQDGHDALFKDSMGIESTLMITRLKPEYYDHYHIRVFENNKDITRTFGTDS